MDSCLLPTIFQAGVKQKMITVKAMTATKMTTAAKPMVGSWLRSTLAREGMMVHRDRKEKKPLALAKSRRMLGGTRPVLRQMMPSTMHQMDMLTQPWQSLPRNSDSSRMAAATARQMKVV